MVTKSAQKKKKKPTIRIPAQKPPESQSVASTAAPAVITESGQNLPPHLRKTTSPELELPASPSRQAANENPPSRQAQDINIEPAAIYTGKFSSLPSISEAPSSQPLQSLDDTSVKPKKDSGHASWTAADEMCLVEQLVRFKPEAGDGGTFKMKTFRKCVEALEKMRTTGGPKTADACSRKYQKVSRVIVIER